MRRREFIVLVGGVTVAWPFAALAQDTRRLRRIGVVMSTAESDPAGQLRVAAFRDELRGLGWSEGHNLKIELRWTGSDADRI